MIQQMCPRSLCLLKSFTWRYILKTRILFECKTTLKKKSKLKLEPLTLSSCLPRTPCQWLVIFSWPCAISHWHQPRGGPDGISQPPSQTLVVNGMREEICDFEACLEFLFPASCWLDIATNVTAALGPGRKPNVEGSRADQSWSRALSHPRGPPHLYTITRETLLLYLNHSLWAFLV